MDKKQIEKVSEWKRNIRKIMVVQESAAKDAAEWMHR